MREGERGNFRRGNVQKTTDELHNIRRDLVDLQTRLYTGDITDPDQLAAALADKRRLEQAIQAERYAAKVPGMLKPPSREDRVSDDARSTTDTGSLSEWISGIDSVLNRPRRRPLQPDREALSPIPGAVDGAFFDSREEVLEDEAEEFPF